MYRNVHKVIFPYLRKVNETMEYPWNKGRKTDIFKLDWSEKDRICKEKFNRWIAKYHTDKDLIYIEDLPEQYENIVQNVTFAIPNNFLIGIRKYTRLGMHEWNDPACSADVSVREICLYPAIAYIETAFRLIINCIYDGDEYLKTIFINILLYKFWSHQINDKDVWDNAKMDILCYLRECENHDLDTINFIESIEENQRQREEQNKLI